MDNQKLENLFNLSLSVSDEERKRSPELETGYNSLKKTWTVIIKFTGSLLPLQNTYPEVKVTILSNQYAILEIPQEQVDAVADLPSVIYMEKPKSLYLETFLARKSSCITSVQQTIGSTSGGGGKNLTGKGTIVGIIDSGIDYAHPDFRRENGTTRILELWDQTISPETLPDITVKSLETLPGSSVELPETLPDSSVELLEMLPDTTVKSPENYNFGSLFTAEVINHALEQPTKALQESICPSRDISGHGTHVAGIAAGNGRASDGVNRGVAYESELLVVKLGSPDPLGFPNTVELMEAVDFCIRRAAEYNKPLALNLSFGNNYGSHSGSALLETFLNDVIGSTVNCICIGTGNEGASGGHAGGVLEEAGTSAKVEFSVSSHQPSLNIQIWKNYSDEFRISVLTPSSSAPILLDSIPGSKEYSVGSGKMYVFYGEPSPYSPYQEIYLDFPIPDNPQNPYLEEGIWTITIMAQKVSDGIWDMWMPSSSARNLPTRFLQPTPEHTLTIPSTAFQGISVAAYDSLFNTLAAFSGRGYTWSTGFIKPDLAAPGVNINSCAPGGGYTAKTGTSMATPFVTGSCALLMQYGIVENRDPYLYGEKIKAYLIRGARRIPAEREYPNPRIGWGTLCLADAIPK